MRSLRAAGEALAAKRAARGDPPLTDLPRLLPAPVVERADRRRDDDRCLRQDLVEVPLAEPAMRLSAGRQRLRNEGRHDGRSQASISSLLK